MWKSLAAALCLVSVQLAAAPPEPFTITPEMQRALDAISPDSLRGNLSFLSSDLLEGRATPSRGLDIAAEFIASRFRAAGLEPGGNDGYFQTAKFLVRTPDPAGFECELANDGEKLSIPATEVKILSTQAASLSATPVFKLNPGMPFDPAQLAGKVLLVEARPGARYNLRGAKPALIIVIDKRPSESREEDLDQLFDPEHPGRPSTPRLMIRGEAAARFAEALKEGAAGATATVHLAAPNERAVILRNVIGILPGSDPALLKTCVLVTAHYDHLGMKTQGEGDRIYNGANDDGSGTVSVIELAKALAKVNPRPKRSIAFIAFFGEEEGLLGSQYYVRHPVYPLASTVADINLEQVGRTDSTEGPQIAAVSITGSGFSQVDGYLQAAGRLSGITVKGDSQNGNRYFAASDNYSFAEAGIPAHTVCVAFQYPDYHGVGDEWRKIDYTNMAKVDRMVADAVLMLAGDSSLPEWNGGQTKTAAFLKAWKSLHP